MRTRGTAMARADDVLQESERIAGYLLDVQQQVNDRIDEMQAELLPGVRRALGRPEVASADLADLVNARIAGLSVVVTPEAVASVLPIPAASAATTRAGRRAVSGILDGADDRLVVIAGPCSIHDPAAALEYAGFIGEMRQRHASALE